MNRYDQIMELIVAVICVAVIASSLFMGGLAWGALNVF